ncbi:MAG: hypothetical protein LT106_18555 [Burkholderiaceae bacterium]|nr:hypothetical protein [Burkholderiaceae bacterium]
MPDAALGMIGASAIGGLLGSDDQSVTQRTELPDFLKPYAPLYAQMGYNLSQMPFNPYPYETVAPFTADQLSAMDMVRGQATGAQNPLYGAAQQQTMDTIGGNYLTPESNPYLQQTFDTAANRVTDAFSRGTAAQTDARFARAGAFGGSAWNEAQQANQTALGDSLSGLAANLYGNNYAQERARQQQAAQFAPSLAGTISSQGYRDADALLNIGGMQQQLGQQYLTDDLGRYAAAQQYPYQQFGQLGQLFNPALGSQSTQTAPGVSPLAGALGGAMGGLGLYNMGQKAGIWGGGGGLLGSATAPAPNYAPGQLGSGTYGINGIW